MTLLEIKRTGKDVLTAADIAPVLGVAPESIREQAKIKPQLLGFPVIRIGSRILFPRKPFLDYMGEQT